jgi:hypothetical protein
MNLRICVGCGEKMGDASHPVSPNPNLCACCSNLADTIETPAVPSLSGPVPPPASESIGEPEAHEEFILSWEADRGLHRIRVRPGECYTGGTGAP